MPDPQPDPPQIVTNAGIAGAITAGVNAAERASRFTPIQVVMIGSMTSMIVITGLLVYLIFYVLGDHKEERLARDQREESFLRTIEESREKDRQFQALEKERDRKNENERNKTLMTHCSSEAQKQRENDETRWEKMNKAINEYNKGVGIFIAEIGKLIKLSGVKPIGGEEVMIPAIAPPPKVKLSS